jgi:hypothetical protein
VNLNETLRALSFSVQSVPVHELEGVDPAIAGIARNGQSISLPALSALPKELADAISAYRLAEREVDLYRQESRGVEQVRRAQGLRAVQAKANTAWVEVLTVAEEHRAEYLAKLREDRAAGAQRLRDAAEELRAAAVAHVENIGVEAALSTGGHPNTARIHADDLMPWRGPLNVALFGNSAIDPDDGLSYALTLLTD